MNRQLTKSSAKLDQIFGRDILVAEDDQLVLDQRVVERLELLVRQRPAKINATDLRAQMDADFRHGDAGRLRADRLALVEFERPVHGAILLRPEPYPPFIEDAWLCPATIMSHCPRMRPRCLSADQHF